MMRPRPEATGNVCGLRGELGFWIESAIAAHPRSRQKTIGPSELGTPCVRRVGYRLAGTSPVARSRPGWKPTVGTAVHSWLEAGMTAANSALGYERFLIETKVDVGVLAGQPVTGHCDLYDRVTCTVVDWKVVGVSSLRSYKTNGPSEQYKVQAHLYGRGLVRAGHPVRDVAIYFLPQNGELHEAHWWCEPYNEHIATAALARAEGVEIALQAKGNDILADLPTSDAWCAFCPWLEPGSQDVTTGCPGDPSRQTSAAQLSALIA